jgi:deazaflavin-dependent oxidoreductase (nitroreductase family)
VGLQRVLDYRPAKPNAVHYGLQALGATRQGSWIFQRTLFRLDRPVHRWTHGKVTVAGLISGIPVILLTTTGAKSGLERTMPVMGVPIGDEVGIIGTNYAQPKAPAWVFNLEAEPRARVSWRDRTCEVAARPATEAEREAIWTQAALYYRGFAEYRKRITERPVQIFVLDPVD